MLLAILFFVMLIVLCIYQNLTLEQNNKENDSMYSEQNIVFTDEDYNFKYRLKR